MEARQAEARAVAQKRRDEAEAAVERVTARIHTEYAVHARAIAELVNEAEAADAAAQSFNMEFYLPGEYEDIAAVRLVHDRLGWIKKFDNPPLFSKSISLPEVDDFPSIGDHAQWLTKLEKFAVLSVGNPDEFLEKAS